jgi:hypothetical protein
MQHYHAAMRRQLRNEHGRLIVLQSAASACFLESYQTMSVVRVDPLAESGPLSSCAAP